MSLIEVQGAPAYDQILQSLFQRSPAQGFSPSFAFTSANSGEGVSYVVESLARQLSMNPANSVLIASVQALASYTGHLSDLAEHCRAGNHTQIYRLEKSSSGSGIAAINSWQTDVRYRQECLQQLRRRFTYVLIDCPSPKKNGDLFSVASLVDGVVIVVEANRTTKAHIRTLERTIEFVQGKIAGFVLNKRQYLIPDWIYNRL